MLRLGLFQLFKKLVNFDERCKICDMHDMAVLEIDRKK